MFSNFAIFIFFYIFILLSTVGYGFLITRLVKQFNISNNLGYLGLIGLFFLVIYSYLSSIFLSHNYLHNSIILTIGFISFLYFLNKNFKKKKSNFFNFSLVFLILFFSSLIFKMHDDFPYYHFPYSYILTQSNFIIGLGQLNLGFRTPSSLFYYNSLFYLPYIKFYMFMMPSILILGFANIIIYEKILNNIKYNKTNYITFFCLLILIFVNVFFYRIGEHGSDKSAQILIFLLIIEILIFLAMDNFSNKKLSKIYLLVGIIISLKAFYILYSILLLILFLKIIKKNKFKNSLLFFLKNSYFIPLIILFTLVIKTYFLNTGCLIYPVSFTCFENFSWSVSKLEVVQLNNWYEQWSKAGAGPNYRIDNPQIYISNFNWVSNWIDRYFFNKVSDFLLGITFLIIVTNLFFYSKKKNKINFPNIFMVLFFLSILLFEWFYNHPALRYGGYSVIVPIIFLFFSIRLNRYNLEKIKLKKRVNTLILITLIIFLGRNFNRIINESVIYSYKPLKDVYYKVDENYFDIPNLINEKILTYNTCEKENKICFEESDLKIKKIFNNYIFYKK